MARILVADDDPDIARLLQDALQNRGHQVVVTSDGRRALARATAEPPDLLVLDRNMPEMNGIEVAQRLRDRPDTANLPIIMLTAQDTEAAVLEGYGAGVDDYVVKPFNPRAFCARVDALLTRVGATRPVTLRKLVAIFSAKAGVGKTTLAVNLAVLLGGLLKPRRVALLDANFQFGDANLLLDLAPEHSMADLVPFAGSIDSMAVERTLIPHRSGIGLLPRPPRPDAAEPINMAMVREVADVLTRLVDVTVADTPTTYDERTLTVLDRADCIVLVVAPELSAVRNAREFLTLAQSIGYSPQRMLLVLNRANQRTGVGASDVREATGQSVSVEIPDGGVEVTLQANLGIPIVLAAPRSEFTRAMNKLADVVATRLGAK